MSMFKNNQPDITNGENGRKTAFQWLKGISAVGGLEKLPVWAMTIVTYLDRPSYAGLLLAGNVANGVRRRVGENRDKIRPIRVIAIGLSGLVLLANVFFMVPKVTAATGINNQINFQGKIVKNDGSRVTDNDYSFTFGIYTANSGGSPLWSESKTVHVAGGLFNTALGDANALPGSIDFNSDSLYLGVNFNSDGEMSPRIRLTATPYALNAKKVAGLTVTDTTGVLTVPNSKTIQFADAFTTSGAFPITLNAGASTNVTLPSSGTLATLDGSEALTNKSINGLTINATTGSLSIPDTETVSFSDAFTTSGLFPLTLSTTASTNVTLPTSGTLTTLTGIEALTNKTYSGNGLTIAATSPPSEDMVTFTNNNQPITTSGVSNLEIYYIGGGTGMAGGLEASAARVDITPGGTPSSLANTWDGLRIVAAADSWPANSVTENGLKIEAPTTIGATTGSYNNIALGTSTSGTANSYDRASISVGTKSSTDQQNYTTLEMGNGGSGYFDLELMRGFINFQNMNMLYDDFIASALDTNKWKWAAVGTGATCNGPMAAVVNGVLQAETGPSAGGSCTLTTQSAMSNGMFQQANNSVFETRWRRTAANTSFRLFAGFTNVTVAQNSDTNTGAHAYILKRATDTAFQCGTANGSAETVTTTGVTITQNTFYRLRVQVSGGTTPTVICTIDDGTTVTRTVVTGTMPGATTLMDYYTKSESSADTSSTFEIDYARAWQDDPPLAQVNAVSSAGIRTTNGGSAQSAEIASTLDNMNISRQILNNGGQTQVIVNGSDNATPVIIMDNRGNATFSGTLTAARVNSAAIDGIEVINTQLKTLSDTVASIKSSASGLAVLPTSSPAPVALPVTAATASAIINFGDISIHRADVATDMKVAGNLLVVTGLTIEGPATFKDDTTFGKLTNFLGTGWFKGEVFFDRSPKFGVDTVGFAVIPQGADHVDVIFSGQFDQVPVINASMAVDSGNSGDPLARQAEIVRRIMQENLLYFVTNQTNSGFSIYLNKPAGEDLTFSWTAFAGDRARTVKAQFTPPVQPVDSPSPGPVPTASPVPTALPAGTSSADLRSAAP
jgi:hypothetical protein